MCGIVGVLRFGDLSKQQTLSSAIYLGTSLLEITEERGKDATGIVSVFDDGMFYGQKMGTSAKKFISSFGKTETDFEGYLSILREYKDANLRTIIGHCRKKSVGESYNNVNNHPIIVDNIIGVHNGTLTNHEEIFKNLTCKRDGDVDSEAIFRLMQHFTDNGKDPFTLDILNEVTKRLSGAFGVIAVNADNPTNIVILKDARPVELCLIKPLKMVLVGSEIKFFDSILYEYNKMAALFAFPNFITLKSSDIEIKSVIDNQYGLIDLTTEITSTTTLENLIVTQKNEPIVNKLWKPVVKEETVYSKANYYGTEPKNSVIYGRTYSTPTVKTTTVSEIKKETTKTSGKIWDPKTFKYIEASDKKNIITNTSTTVINLENKAVLDLKTTDVENNIHNMCNEKDILLFNKVTNNVEKFNWMHEGVKVNRVQITNQNIITDVVNEKIITNKINTLLLSEIKTQSSEGKDTSKNEKDAIDAASKAVVDIKKFFTEEEIALECEVEPTNLKLLSIPSLINRLFKSFFYDIFTKGWLAKCATITDIERTELTVKINSARKNIYVLKKLATVFSTSIEELDIETKKKLTNMISSNIKNNTVLTPERMLKVFNVGDIKTNNVLAEIIKLSK